MMRKTTIILAALLFGACNFHNEISSEGDTPSPIVTPTITLDESDTQLTTSQEFGLWLQPAIDGTYDSLVWTLDGAYIGSEPKMHITAEEGTHLLNITAIRRQGDQTATASVSRTIRIVRPEALPLQLYAPQTEYTIALGTTLHLAPVIFAPQPQTEYRWSVNGVEVKSGSEAWLDFSPEMTGYYDIRFATDTDFCDFGVVCIGENIAARPRTEESHTSADRVLEYQPAAGQFINTGMGGRTPEQYAFDKLQAGEILSLGGFGGYIVVGFDHSIVNGEGYDLRIRGNSFDNSSEPGVVWVMQDLNGNGEADEVWYELKGSATGTADVQQDMAVTYLHNTNRARGTIQWRASDGSCGTIERNAYHTDNNYYPEWIPHNLTLGGTMLHNKVQYIDGKVVSLPYGDGYADNQSAECVNGWNLFDIANAINHQGCAVELSHIDFVRVQSGVCYSAAVIGEISTEISAIEEIER